ncbi:MAG: hypothetical protein ACFB12_04335 [Leptolyngbyaceae cyanobacterium]
MALTEQYLDLVNHQLPPAARQQRYPVRFNHCFARIILDNVCGCEWYRAIKRPAYKNMTSAQLTAAIALGHTFLAQPSACFVANQKSLMYRRQANRDSQSAGVSAPPDVNRS